MREENGIDFIYQGTVFELTEDRGRKWTPCYQITGLKEHGDNVEFPSQANGRSIKHLSFHKDTDHIYPGVKKIIIPADLEISCLENRTFPDLEEILLSPKHKEFSTDGKMLYKEKDHELYLAMCAGREDTVTVPKGIKKLSNKAFQYTKCREIIFENQEIQPEDSTFENSAWLKNLEEQQEPVYVGNTLYKVMSSNPIFVKPTTTRFSRHAFETHVPIEITTPIVPPANMTRGNRHCPGPCKILNLTMEKKRINWDAVATLKGLEAIHFTGHALYKEVDGVVFSKDGSTLLYYPDSKPASSYVIPDNTRIIGRRAFAGQKHLTKVSMPDSVTRVYQGAFMNCNNLEEIDLSDNITEIPDATSFQRGGVFEHCPKLKKIHLPKNLEHLGSHAFAHCVGLKEISLPPKLRMLGEHAFLFTGLQEISLPRSLNIVGQGALMFTPAKTPKIYAFEGTARGLVGGIEAVPPGLVDGTANILWHPAVIVLLESDGSVKDEITIPKSLRRASCLYIDIAWNQEKFDYDTYASCFEDVSSSKEKIDLTIKMLKTKRNLADTPYESYLNQMGSKIIKQIIDSCDEPLVMDFLKYDILSKTALKKSLKQCINKGLNTAAAYILELLGDKLKL